MVSLEIRSEQFSAFCHYEKIWLEANKLATLNMIEFSSILILWSINISAITLLKSQ